MISRLIERKQNNDGKVTGAKGGSPTGNFSARLTANNHKVNIIILTTKIFSRFILS